MSDEKGYLPLTMVNREEGDFLKDADSALTRMQSTIAAYMEHHGTRAKGAKGVVRLDVEFIATDAGEDTEQVTICTTVRVAEPPRPKVIRQAFTQPNDDGGHILLLRRPKASAKDAPGQMFLNDTKKPEPSQAPAGEKD